MSIKNFGKSNHRGRSRGTWNVGCWTLFFFLCGSIFCTVSSAEVYYAVGRGTEKNGTVWQYDAGQWSIHSEIPNCSEVFGLLVDKSGKLYACGNYYSYCTVWKFDGHTWDKGTAMPDGRGLYAMVLDKQGNIWVGGTGEKNVWKFDGNKWDEGTKLNNCIGIYALTVDDKGNVWAGGEGKSQVWCFNGQQWDDGVRLSECTDVFTLYADKKGTVWAGGRGNKVIWWFNRELEALSGKTTANSVLPPTTQEKTDSGIPKWTLGSILLDCSEISSISQDSQGNLYAAGAGKNKVWIKKSDVDFWSGINLPECIAVYAIMAGNPVIAGGWNNGKRGRMWSKSGTEWDNGTDIEKSYVIRSIVAKK